MHKIEIGKLGIFPHGMNISVRKFQIFFSFFAKRKFLLWTLPYALQNQENIYAPCQTASSKLLHPSEFQIIEPLTLSHSSRCNHGRCTFLLSVCLFTSYFIVQNYFVKSIVQTSPVRQHSGSLPRWRAKVSHDNQPARRHRETAQNTVSSSRRVVPRYLANCARRVRAVTRHWFDTFSYSTKTVCLWGLTSRNYTHWWRPHRRRTVCTRVG